MEIVFIYLITINFVFSSIIPLQRSNPSSKSRANTPYSLAGIQVGWLTSPNVDLVRACEAWRAYTIVSASQIDRQIALYALHEGRLHNLLKRNNALARHNLALLEGFIEQNRWACESAKPVAGSVACVRVSKMVRLVHVLGMRAGPGILVGMKGNSRSM